jgi:hypothetical protein
MTQHSVNIQIDGNNPEAVEVVRKLISWALDDYLTAHDQTTISRYSKYEGTNLARMTAVVSQELLDNLKE